MGLGVVRGVGTGVGGGAGVGAGTEVGVETEFGADLGAEVVTISLAAIVYPDFTSIAILFSFWSILSS